MNTSRYLHWFLSQLIRLLNRLPRPMATWLIRLYLRIYPVRLEEAANPDIRSYANFNEFFTRPLAQGLRPLKTSANGIYSPVDGSVSQLGRIEEGQMIQAKGIFFSGECLCTSELKPPQSGNFITIYLAPQDYHRVHAPVDLELRRAVRIGGHSMPVSDEFTDSVQGLYCRNRRVVFEFDSEFGRLILVMVGARNVAAISTVWHWPPSLRTYIPDGAFGLKAGEELGRFNVGSTVIVLCEFPLQWSQGLACNSKVNLAQTIARASSA